MKLLKTTKERLSSPTQSYWGKSLIWKWGEKLSFSSTYKIKLHSQKVAAGAQQENPTFEKQWLKKTGSGEVNIYNTLIST